MSEPPKEVSENLYPGENVFYCLKKKLTMELKPKFLVVTDRRIIYLDQKILGRYELMDVPYEKLEFVRFYRGIIGSEFVVKKEDGKEISLSWMEKEEAEKAIEAIRDALNTIAVVPVSIKKTKGIKGVEIQVSKPKEIITRTMPMARVVEKTTMKKEDPLERLKKLKELYEAGVISKEEFEERKRKLLDQI
ncbi:MAG: PH domain-containing protein [Archaeoglobales archaeon]|nr:PH domain-containing protein [Archaeoglobales archaeon]